MNGAGSDALVIEILRERYRAWGSGRRENVGSFRVGRSRPVGPEVAKLSRIPHYPCRS